MPVALNCCEVPLAIDGFAGVTAIDANTAVPTVKVVLPVTPTDAALIWEVPLLTPVARPLAVIVAAPAFDETHFAELVKSSVDPSE